MNEIFYRPIFFFLCVSRNVSKMNRGNIQTRSSPVPHWQDSIPNFCYSKNEICYSKIVFLRVFAIAKNFCYSKFYFAVAKIGCFPKKRMDFVREWNGIDSLFLFATRGEIQLNAFMCCTCHLKELWIGRRACQPRTKYHFSYLGDEFLWKRGGFLSTNT